MQMYRLFFKFPSITLIKALWQMQTLSVLEVA